MQGDKEKNSLAMDGDKKVRTVLRRQFSITGNQFENLLNKAESDLKLRVEATASHKVAESLFNELSDLDSKIRAAILCQPDWQEEALEKEMEETRKYSARWALLHARFKAILEKVEPEKVETKHEHVEKKFKLPALEFKKFDGNIKSWLSFWGQFKKIDADPSIEEIDKLQYLSQSMQQDSEVKSFVEGFPLTAESYKLCISELKSRYAREDMLIQIYVRELLSLILNKDKNCDLMSLYDNISSHLRALEVLKVTKEKYSAFLLPMVESALPTEILRAWERGRPIGGKDELNGLLDFLKKEVESNQRISLASEFKIDNRLNTIKTEPAATCLTINPINKKEIVCVWCEKAHASTECFRIARMTLEDRREHLKKKKACALCLKIGHHAKICKSFIKCYVCSQRHSPVLCPGKSMPNISEKAEQKTAATVIQNHSSETSASPTSTTLLQTVTVWITHGQRAVTVRAMYDSGSQRSYVKEEVMKKLGIAPAGSEGLSHSLFGGATVSFKNYNTYDVTVQNLDKSFEFKMNALGQTTICKNVPKVNINNKSLSELLNKNQIKLTDTDSEGSDIGLLIGADYSGLLLTNTFVQLETGLTAIKTSLGWTLQGKTNNAVINCDTVTSLFCCQNVTDFWNLEILGIQDPVQVQSKQQKEEEVMMSFEESIQINDEGMYEVQLPWKTDHDNLLSNRTLVLRRLESATNKLVSSGKFHDYNKILQEWERAGIIECVPEPDSEENKVHYLPHRAVSKESSLTTKLRSVYDASAKDKNGKSLNACLEKGINFLDKIPNLLMGFRKGAYGVSGDISKAFLQISVTPVDRDFLRFLWWKDESCKEVQEYRHCRVVFGLTSSPFLLSATIAHHLNKTTGEMKETADLLAKSFYVDNCVTSLEKREETLKFVSEAKKVMKEAKFDLRQWVVSPQGINETEKVIVSVLGILWNTDTDELTCNLNNLPDYSSLGKITKKDLLSLINRVFDPVGFTCPATLTPRLILQETWRRSLSWDEELPKDLEVAFRKWYEHLHCLKDCRIPRRLTETPINESKLSLHMLCDASKVAYGACVFLRAEKDSKVSVQLISAKSRVAPPEKATIPRLELTAALIGSRLLAEARKSLGLKVKNEYCWTDSSVAYYWITKTLPWNVYVHNRVKEISQNTNLSDWHHIPGTLNWADVASRGCTAEQLLALRWWEGPEWLRLDPADWPKSMQPVDESEACKELRRTVCTTNVCIEQSTERFCYFSKYSKIIRMTAWILRFKQNTKQKEKKKGEISCDEYEEAEKRILKMIQTEEKDFLNEKISNLTTYLDGDGLIKVKTKLLLSDLPEITKFPILLPAKNIIVKRMVEQKHRELHHTGANQLTADIRTKFWIIGIRRLAKSVIAACVTCARFKAKAVQPTTAPLPSERLTCTAPFQVSGVDLAGPLYLRNGEKCWVVLYTCAVYRCVHLELTNSLSTEAFMLTLRRFIARRGRTRLFISDNGTNFVGTKNLLIEIDWEEVQKRSTINHIEWKMNAPTAAWWGGFFERLIRIMKDLLKRILGTARINYEELETILCECEAIMNARPLTYVQDDNNSSLEPLTPSCFLQPIPQTDVTDLDVVDAKSLNTRLRYLQKLKNDYKERFKNEYLTTLVQRGKEMKGNLKRGDIVLIETEEKRIKWPLGLIEEIYTGKDGINRTAKVKTAGGYKIRPFQRLFPLEVSVSEAESEGQQGESQKGNSTLYNTYISRKKENTAEKEKVCVEPTHPMVTRCGRPIKIPSRYDI